MRLNLKLFRVELMNGKTKFFYSRDFVELVHFIQLSVESHKIIGSVKLIEVFDQFTDFESMKQLERDLFLQRTLEIFLEQRDK